MFVAVSLSALAVPARRGYMVVAQPDGSSVRVLIRGDEHSHVMLTSDGCAVTKGSDGYLHYLHFDPDGSRTDTGVEVTDGADPSTVEASRAVPYEALNRQAAASRRMHRVTPMTGRSPEMVTRADSKPVYRAVIILAQFSDLQFTYGQDYFEDLVNKSGYNLNGAAGSCLDYFKDQFGDSADFSFTVGPVVTLPKGYAYYGQNDKDGQDSHPEEAVSEACRLSDAEVDFSQSDYVFMFYAGGNPADGGASDDHIWPHSWSLAEAGIDLVLDGKRISTYSCTSELMNTNYYSAKMEFASIGTFCHEYGHALGLPDFYDTDYEQSGGDADGFWFTTSIMDGGSYNNGGRTPPAYNAVELYCLGLLEPENLEEGEYTLEPVSSSRRALYLESGTRGEFFLYEARQALGWDKYIGGSGMLVYHIDMSSRNAGYSTYYGTTLKAMERWTLNEVNCRPDNQCADLVECYPKASEVAQVFFPYSSLTTLSARTVPDYKCWSGAIPSLSLTNIKKTNGTVTFKANGILAVDTEDEYQDAVILQWHTDFDEYSQLPASVSWTASGAKHTAEVQPYSDGKYAYVVEGLSPDTDYKIKISLNGSGVTGGEVTVNVTTKAVSGLPFIYLESASRNSQGRFTVMTHIPLRVWNATGTKSVTWYWDDAEISRDDDCYYQLTKDGTLKAVVTYKDGSQEIFVKQITIR